MHYIKFHIKTLKITFYFTNICTCKSININVNTLKHEKIKHYDIKTGRKIKQQRTQTPSHVQYGKKLP